MTHDDHDRPGAGTDTSVRARQHPPSLSKAPALPGLGLLDGFEYDDTEAWVPLRWSLRCETRPIDVTPANGRSVRFLVPARWWLEDSRGRRIELRGELASEELLAVMRAVRDRLEAESAEVQP